MMENVRANFEKWLNEYMEQSPQEWEEAKIRAIKEMEEASTKEAEKAMVKEALEFKFEEQPVCRLPAKVVQIITHNVDLGDDGDDVEYIFALCEDGSIWEAMITDWKQRMPGEALFWIQVHGSVPKKSQPKTGGPEDPMIVYATASMRNLLCA